jgi:4-carboxymuconolactone decarboxylase
MNEESETPYDRGLAVLRDVYAGDVVNLPEGTMAFNDVMVKTLFDQVWRRGILDVRSRRLLLMGVIAANGQVDTWRIQARAALRRGELSPDELRETLIMLAPYAGYPNIAGLVVPCEEVIGTWVAEGRPSWDGEDGEDGQED